MLDKDLARITLHCFGAALALGGRHLSRCRVSLDNDEVGHKIAHTQCIDRRYETRYRRIHSEAGPKRMFNARALPSWPSYKVRNPNTS